MKRAISDADRAVSKLFRQQGDLITRSQSLSIGLTEGALRQRLGPTGQWRVVLPGIYLSHKGELAIGQLEIAAVLYAGRDCVITGPAALRRMGVRVPLSRSIDVLIPATTRRLSTAFVQVHRTNRMPARPWSLDGLRWAPPARAAADAVRGEIAQRDVRAIVADAVQQGKCTVEQLAVELRAGPKQGSSSLRAALEEVADGIASVAEGDFRKLIKNGGLPTPMYNPELYVGEAFIARPDAWWPRAGVAAEVDSREWHLSPAAWERTQARHDRMSAHGILVLHYAPRRIRSELRAVMAELRAAIEAGQRRPALAVRTVPAA